MFPRARGGGGAGGLNHTGGGFGSGTKKTNAWDKKNVSRIKAFCVLFPCPPRVPARVESACCDRAAGFTPWSLQSVAVEIGRCVSSSHQEHFVSRFFCVFFCAFFFFFFVSLPALAFAPSPAGNGGNSTHAPTLLPPRARAPPTRRPKQACAERDCAGSRAEPPDQVPAFQGL